MTDPASTIATSMVGLTALASAAGATGAIASAGAASGEISDDAHDGEGSVLSSVSKALSILELVGGAAAEPVGVSEVAAAAGMPKSTTHRLLRALEEHGFVGRVGAKYRIGNRFIELSESARFSEYGELRDVASEPLAWLFDRTGATVHLAVLKDRDVLYLEKITCGPGCRLPSRVGGRFPATCTALGKAILAFSEPAVVANVMSAPLARATPYSVRSPQVLIGQLREARSTGLSFEVEEARLGMSCVAAPVLHDDKVVAAISFSNTSQTRVQPPHALREAAERISRLLVGV
jgi:DNA-binding IclR family transcriptional regulator